jgi:hypothetical protein
MELAKLEEELGFRSSFNFVPERYPVSTEIQRQLVRKGFEVGVHDLKHDGKLYDSRETFQEGAKKINRYLEDWGSVGFRSGSMHHNLDWLLNLDIEYDSSTFDTDPFEPFPDGVGTIFPFLFNGSSSRKGYVELPYTLPQDFTLFVLMRETDTGIWKKKLEWIVRKGGMALLNTHPDYMYFYDKKKYVDEYPATFYREFLEHVKDRYNGHYWHVLAKEASSFARNKLGIGTRP